MRTASVTALRRRRIEAQGYASRSRRGTEREVEETIRRLSCVQLDSITALERSHRIALGVARRRVPARDGEFKPAPKRFGYDVPFLWRDRIVGRADLKSDCAEEALLVKAFHLEPGVRRSAALDDALGRALDRLRRRSASNASSARDAVCLAWRRA
jgi:uncharacterized protein YcaQ